MILEMFFGSRDRISSWKVGTAGLIEGISNTSVGSRRTHISCRENLYHRIRDGLYFANFVDKKLTVRVELPRDTNIGDSYKLLSSTVFGRNFSVNTEGWLEGTEPSHPLVYSLLVLLLQKYSRLYEKNKPNTIPLDILDSIIDTRISSYEFEMINTAFISWIFLNKKYDNSTESFLNNYKAGEPNGPGRMVTRGTYYFNNFTDINGEFPASRWWKFNSVKSRLIPITERLNVPEEINYLKNLMESKYV